MWYKKVWQKFYIFEKISKLKIGEKFQIRYMKNGYNKWRSAKKKKLQKSTVGKRVSLLS